MCVVLTVTAFVLITHYYLGYFHWNIKKKYLTSVINPPTAPPLRSPAPHTVIYTNIPTRSIASITGGWVGGSILHYGYLWLEWLKYMHRLSFTYFHAFHQYHGLSHTNAFLVVINLILELFLPRLGITKHLTKHISNKYKFNYSKHIWC